MIDTVPGEDVKIRDHLDRFLITEDVRIEVVSEQFDCVYLLGEAWPRLLQEALRVDVSQLARYGHLVAGGNAALVRRLDVTAAPGFEVLAAPEALATLISAFQSADEVERPVQMSPQAFDAYRIDAGFPMYGIDLSEDDLAQEAARTDRAISFTKGCYLGQEPIARIDALGHVNRELRVVVLKGAAPGPAPLKVVEASTRNDLGKLTSIGRLPGHATVALGMLKVSATPGSQVTVVTEAGDALGEVVTAANPQAAGR
jgi:folate-binding protein YgfZ